MMLFEDFLHEYKLKNKETSIIKIQRILSFLSLNDIEIYLKGRPFESDIGIANINPSTGMH